MTLRTQAEIVARIEGMAGDRDPITPVFEAEALSQFLDYDEASSIRRPGCTREEWGESQPLTRDGVLAVMRDYAEFGWGKVADHRGISAERTIVKMQAWLWLLGEGDLDARVEVAGYAMYGAPKLALICEAFGFPIPDDEDVRRMIDGRPCGPDCRGGCLPR